MSEAEFLLFFIPTMSIVISILIGMIVISDDEFAYIVRSIKYKTKNRYHCKNFRRNSCPYSFYDTNVYCKCRDYKEIELKSNSIETYH